MRTSLLAALAVCAIVGCFLLLGSQIDGIVGFYRENLSPAKFAVWLTALSAATLAPPVLALAFWQWAKRLSRGWILHVLLLPATIAVVRVFIGVMLEASGEPDSDSLSGWASDPAVLLMMLCPLAYFIALAAVAVRRSRQAANDS